MENLEKYSSLDINAEAVQMILKMSQKDPSIMVGLIDSVLETSPGIIQGISEGVKNNDRDKVSLESHSLKSSSSLVGAVNLSVLCKNLEHCSKEEDLNKIEQFFDEICKEYQAVKKDLENWKRDLEGA